MSMAQSCIVLPAASIRHYVPLELRNPKIYQFTRSPACQGLPATPLLAGPAPGFKGSVLTHREAQRAAPPRTYVDGAVRHAEEEDGDGQLDLGGAAVVHFGGFGVILPKRVHELPGLNCQERRGLDGRQIPPRFLSHFPPTHGRQLLPEARLPLTP